jgi:hypothetical protein
MYDAINKGLRLSTGEILGYLNCDDIYTPWAIEVAVGAFQANPSVDVIYGDGLTIDVATRRQRLSLTPPFDRRWLAASGSLVQPAVFWRRRVYERHCGFDASLRFVGDLEYWLRVAGSAEFLRVDEVLAIERVHPAALSSASSDRMAAEGRAMRRGHHGSTGWRERGLVVVARARAAWWRRRLLWAFIRARRSEQRPARWARFLQEGDVRLSPARLVLALVPRLAGRFAWDAVSSGRQWFSQNPRRGDTTS